MVKINIEDYKKSKRLRTFYSFEVYLFDIARPLTTFYRITACSGTVRCEICFVKKYRSMDSAYGQQM